MGKTEVLLVGLIIVWVSLATWLVRDYRELKDNCEGSDGLLVQEPIYGYLCINREAIIK